MEKIAVLSISGGLDSTALLIHLLKKEYDEIHAISFYYGQKNELELQKLNDNLDYLKEHNFNVNHIHMDLSGFMGNFNSSLTSDSVNIPTGKTDKDKMKLNFVPNRNAIFSSLIYGYAVSLLKDKELLIDIGLGVHDGSHTVPPDCTRAFFEKLESAFKEGNVESDKINYYLPYVDGYKHLIVKDALQCCETLDLDFNTIFTNSSSCYNPNEENVACGNCGACKDRLLAFEQLNMEDPLKYE